MLFLKIGKDKHKFKLRLSFNKLMLPQNWEKIVKEATKKNAIDSKDQKFYRIKFTRGSSHQQIADSIRIKKNYAKFDKKEHIIPMTLFYDEEQKLYLQKQAEVKLFQVDQFDKQQKIAESKLNLGQYACKGKLMMEFELDYAEKYAKYTKKISKENPNNQIPGPIMVIQFFMQRQDDDSKSVQTFSTDQMKFNFNKGKDIKDRRLDSKQNSNISKNQNLMLKNKQRNSGSEEQFFINQKQKLSRDTQKAPKNKTVEASLYSKNGKLQKTEDTSRKNQTPEKRSQIQFGQKQRQKKLNFVGKYFGKQDKKEEDNEYFVKQVSSKYDALQIQKQSKTDEMETGSTQFQLYLLKKQLEQKDKQLKSAKSQVQNFKKIVGKLNEQKFEQQKKQLMNDKQAGFGKKERLNQQIQNYKKYLIDRDLKINDLEGQLKQLKQRQNGHERTILKQNKQIEQLKMKLQSTKYSIVSLMQRGFESGDKQLINFIQQNLHLDQ